MPPHGSDELNDFIPACAETINRSQGIDVFHVFNEPNLKMEWAKWNPELLPARFMDYLIPCLETMYSVEGIIPVFTPLAPGGDYWDTSFLKEALAIINQKGKKYLYDKMAIGIHNYAFNKPLNLGKGGSSRWTCAKPYQRPPGCEDHTGFYLFEWYDEIVRQRTGRRLPLPVWRVRLQDSRRQGRSSYCEGKYDEHASQRPG